MRALTLTIALGLASLAFGGALAQTVEDVEFAKGNFGGMVQGKIVGRQYADYRLAAKGSQEIFAELTVASTDGDGTVYFNILPPGSDEPLYLGSMDDDNTALVDLPTDGTYTIRVYLMGNDEAANRTVAFNLDLSIQ